MRRYEISVNDTTYEIDVDELSPTQFVVEFEGQTINVDLNSQSEAGGALISPEIEALEQARTTGRTPVKAPKVPASARSETPRTPAPAVTGGAALAHSMTAPMPGVIYSVDVSPGDQVSKGDVVMVLEAMKMNNALHAPQDGVIEEIHVAVGDQVKYGQMLLRFAKD